MDDRLICNHKDKVPDLKVNKTLLETGTKPILYFENRKIRHMERMFDLFLALFR